MYIDNKRQKNYISFWLGAMFWIITIMIIVGGLTRLTDSGLSITQWQLFSGILPPRLNVITGMLIMHGGITWSSAGKPGACRKACSPRMPGVA